MHTFNSAVKKVKDAALNLTTYGLKGGVMGAVLFLFYYQHFTEDDRYEKIAFDLLESVLLKISVNEHYDYASGITGIGNTLLFLTKENLINVDSSDFFDDLDEIVLKKMQSKIIVNFSHDTGIIGLCRYAIQRPIKTEILQYAFHHLTKGFEKTIYDINPIFLFPSEILQDIKLFLLEIAYIKEVTKQIAELNQSINSFEREYSILQSNYSDYMLIQQLREAEIRSNKEETKQLLAIIEKESSDAVLEGLAYMNLAKPSLPPWWKLF
ncbi:MAG: hypothetical protein LBI15_09405 [Dysgonamonadaceae bacterium]|jgi:hypothetical protein|nr:hypothetical protein [Dysgonamonadaceae bacterium]